jgi:hypothetical protein
MKGRKEGNTINEGRERKRGSKTRRKMEKEGRKRWKVEILEEVGSMGQKGGGGRWC